MTWTELEVELLGRPGLIPVAIDATRGQTTWLDLDGYHFYEGFFRHSLEIYTSLRGDAAKTFVYPLESLEWLGHLDPEIRNNCLQPAGFIFHAGRCGSTLLVKALARSRENLVFGEAAAHNQIWGLPSAGTDREIGLFRNLVLLMGRRRLPSYAAHIVKFTSYNILRFDLIRRAFPDTPALFLFREPGAIIESCRRQPPGWLGKPVGQGRAWSTPEAAVEDYFRGALAVQDASFRCLDYASLKVEALPGILRFFGLSPSPAEIRSMASEFAWDAKSGVVPKLFLPRPAASAQHVPERLVDLYSQLGNHARQQL